MREMEVRRPLITAPFLTALAAPLLFIVIGAGARSLVLVYAGMVFAGLIIYFDVSLFLMKRYAAEWWRVISLFLLVYSPFLLLFLLVEVFVF
jgi:hypothetical protein